MKTNHLIPLLLALLTLGACVSPQDEATDCQECNEQQIIIKLASDNAPATRAGRPLTSNQPNQDVDRVMLIVCKVEEGTDNNQIVYTKLLTDWMTSSEIYIDQNDRRGRTDRVRLREEEQLPKGSYKVYAIAYTYKDKDTDNQTQYKVEEKSLNDYCAALVASYTGETFNENLILSLTDAPGEELFAGSQEFTVYPTGFTTQVVLNRQVAGVYLYVEDIPYYEGLAKLRLMPAADNDGLVLGQFANEDIAENEQGTKGLYVMNGTNAKATTEDKQPLCEIKLADWLGGNGVRKDGNLVSTENWEQPDYYPKEKYAFKEGSFFGGSFVIPFAASETTTTNSLEIQLIKDDDSVIKDKKWRVTLPPADLTKQTNIYYWENNAFTQTLTPSVTESVTNYSLLRNHLYCIGYKSTDKNAEQDIPQSLYDQVDIQLKVIAEWDIIYDMVLEPDSSRQ